MKKRENLKPINFSDEREIHRDNKKVIEMKRHFQVSYVAENYLLVLYGNC